MISLKASAIAFLHDHAVRGRPLFPAAAFMEAATAAAYQLLADETAQQGCLKDIAFLAPLLLAVGKGREGGYVFTISLTLRVVDYSAH